MQRAVLTGRTSWLDIYLFNSKNQFLVLFFILSRAQVFLFELVIFLVYGFVIVLLSNFQTSSVSIKLFENYFGEVSIVESDKIFFVIVKRHAIYPLYFYFTDSDALIIFNSYFFLRLAESCHNRFKERTILRKYIKQIVFDPLFLSFNRRLYRLLITGEYLLSKLDDIHDFLKVILCERGQKQNKIFIQAKLELANFNHHRVHVASEIDVCVINNEQEVAVFLVYLFCNKSIERLKL